MQPLTEDERRDAICRKLRRKGFVLAANEIERLEKMVEFLAREVAGPYGIVTDVIKAAEEHACSR